MSVGKSSSWPTNTLTVTYKMDEVVVRLKGDVFWFRATKKSCALLGLWLCDSLRSQFKLTVVIVSGFTPVSALLLSYFLAAASMLHLCCIYNLC
jgi:hypothetical protein